MGWCGVARGAATGTVVTLGAARDAGIGTVVTRRSRSSAIIGYSRAWFNGADIDDGMKAHSPTIVLLPPEHCTQSKS